MGLCQDMSGNVYVADLYNKRVQVLGPDLVFKKEFKCQGITRGVAVDSLGTLHVATSSGLESFPGESARCSKSGSCVDVAVSHEGYLFVSHFLNNGKIQIHKPDESPLGTIDQLKDPFGVYSDQNGWIYVADYKAKKVHKY